MSGTGVLGESFAPVVLSTAAYGPAGPAGRHSDAFDDMTGRFVLCRGEPGRKR